MKRSMLVCAMFSLWLVTGCVSENGGQASQATNESGATGQAAVSGLGGELVINEGYGNYLLVPAGAFSMGDNYDEGNPNPTPQRRYPWGVQDPCHRGGMCTHAQWSYLGCVVDHIKVG